MRSFAIIYAVRKSPLVFFSCGFVLLVYCYIALYLLSYDQAWSGPESVVHREQLFKKTGRELCFKDVLSALDYNAFEYRPRISRPLSNILDVLNIKLRVWLWKFF